MTIGLLTDRTIAEIERLGKDRFPNEAVGLILSDGTVLELANKHPLPRSNFMFDIEDIVILLQVNHISLDEDEWKNLTLWHTHPSGNVGPSRTDMRARLPYLGHLVVTISPTDVPIATWY